MRELSPLSLLKSYIKDHKKIIIFFILTVLIFLMIIRLYNLPLSAVGYAALLSVVLGLIFFIYDFYFYRRQNMDLAKMFLSVSDTVDGLPAGRTFTEKNYRDLLILAHDSRLEQEIQMNTTFNQMIDYYTLWVHQVKTPIAGIKLMLQSADRNISRDLKKDLSSEIFRIEQYVDMVLSYMRLESESTDYVIKECDLDSIIKESVRKFATMFISKKISLNYTETKMTVLTDAKWLGFALDQILSNSIKYTETGTVSIHKTDNNRDEIIIEDTGIGISEEDLPRIFEKGFTGYNGRIEKKSTGIGLFLTRMIIERLGHSITIESAPGTGTKVIIDLSSEKILSE